jgi:DNA-binding GntR family transcriptional regulator
LTRNLRFGTKNSFVEEAIREAIIRGEVQPGEWLRSDDWANRLGVSPTPVREALRKLEAEGLVKIYPHRGAQVAGFDLSDFVEVYQIRAVLEGLAARMAITESSDEDFQELLEVLEESCARIVQAEREKKHGEMRQANHEFHMALYEAAGAPRLEGMIKNLWATFPWDTLSLVPGRPERAADEHEEILEAVRARDGDRVAELITHHVQTAAKALLAYAESVGVSLWEPAARRLLAQQGSLQERKT